MRRNTTFAVWTMLAVVAVALAIHVTARTLDKKHEGKCAQVEYLVMPIDPLR
jgi:hypothetical protein